MPGVCEVVASDPWRGLFKNRSTASTDLCPDSSAAAAGPGPRHARAASTLGGKLGGPFDWDGNGPGGWFILDEPELHLGEDIVVPDVAGWLRTRLPALPEEAFFRLAPDWICEVLSPNTARFDKGEKLSVSAKAGVPHAWLVDPLARTLDVLELVSGEWVLRATHGNEDVVRAAPFDAVPLELARLWG